MLFDDTTQTLKLIDFGFAKMFESNHEKEEDTIGTIYYMAPEVLKGSHNV